MNQPGDIDTEAIDEPDGSEKPLADSWAFWSPLVITVSIYCIVVFASATAFELRNGSEYFVAAVAGILFATSQLTAIFAALGTENYWRRLVITQACMMFVCLSLLGGISVTNPGTANPTLSITMACVLVASSFSTQLVFGFFRVAANWRFHINSVDRGPVYNLKDLFALTAWPAISIAFLNGVSHGDLANFTPVLASVAIGFGVGTLVYGIPTLMTTYSLNESEQAVFAQLIILISMGFLIVMPFAAMGATMITGPLLVFLGSCSVFTWVPLAYMRDKGFVLTKGKDKKSKRQRRMTTGKNR